MSSDLSAKGLRGPETARLEGSYRNGETTAAEQTVDPS